MLFAAAAVLLVSLVLHRATPKALRLMAMMLPILVLGMIFNGRRMVWVQIGMVFLTLYLRHPDEPRQAQGSESAARLRVRSWRFTWRSAGTRRGASSSRSQTIRSVVDPRRDASSQTREIEDYDLIYTVSRYPLLGAGYGNGYWEMIPLPPMGYALERYCPAQQHARNVGHLRLRRLHAMTLLWVAGVYFGMRAYHASTKGTDRAAAMMSFGVVLIYEIQCWGDMGLGSWTGVFLMAPALSSGGQARRGHGRVARQGTRAKGRVDAIAHPGRSSARQLRRNGRRRNVVRVSRLGLKSTVGQPGRRD